MAFARGGQKGFAIRSARGRPDWPSTLNSLSMSYSTRRIESGPGLTSSSNGNSNSQEGGRNGSAVLAPVLRFGQFHKLGVELLHFPMLFGSVESIHGRAIES